jgi:phosphohistidine phosphatase
MKGVQKMKLLVIRHGLAEDRDEFARTGKDDSERPLTRDGRRKMRQNAKGLREIVEGIDLVATSPLIRAQQTAEIVSEVFSDARIETIDTLTPDREPAELMSWLLTQVGSGTVSVVGHDPHLGRLVSFALAGHTDSFVELKKGGACLLQFENEPAASKARLLWLLTPAQLRELRS